LKGVLLTLQVGVFYLFSWAGGWIQKALHLSIPGSLIGMLLLCILLFSGVLPVKWFEAGAGKLLLFLPLFVIPSTAGLMEYFSFLMGKGSVMFFTVVLSTFITLIASAYMSEYLMVRKKKRTGMDGS
jgi:holin-like protein